MSTLRNSFLGLTALIVLVVSCVLLSSRKRPTLQTEVTKSSSRGLAPLAILPPGGGEPMALSLSYWEQASCASHNLFDLQCWASAVNISKVVSPRIESYDKSVFHFSMKSTTLKFEDLFDLEHWNNNTLRLGFSPLASQDYFMKHAVRDIVYVHIKYSSSMQCEPLSSIHLKDWHKALAKEGFGAISVSCVDLTMPPHYLSPEAFRQQVFKGVNPKKVSLVFNLWEGIGRTNFRIVLKGSKCAGSLDRVGGLSSSPSNKKFAYAANNSIPRTLPSNRISKYVDHFLSQYIPDGRYISVMLRTEKLFRSKDNKDFIFIPPENNTCARNILFDWKAMVERSNISKTLFFSDIGGHGSLRWSNPSALNFSQYLHDTFHVKVTLSDINSAFEKITNSQDSVQIAILQQQLVARSTCALIVGGGSFQGMTFNMYAHNHKGRECYSVRATSCNTLYSSFP